MSEEELFDYESELHEEGHGEIIDLDPEDALSDPVIKKPTWRNNKDQRIKNPNMYSQQHKRSIAERERDLAFITELYLKGMSQADLAQRLSEERDYSISRAMIYKDINLIHERWMQAYILPINEMKVRELARLDRLENEYWSAWERSKQDFTSIKQDTIDDSAIRKSAHGALAPTHSRKKTVIEKKERDGNVHFLEGVERCIDKRCQILGLDAAKSVTINWRKQAEAEGIDPDKVVNDLTEQFISAASSGMGRRSLPRSVGESS